MTPLVRPLREADLPAADHICRLAFGTFVGLSHPTLFFGDADYVRTRWRADPAAAFAAEVDGELVGSNFAIRWGTVGLFGPLSVRPDLWNRGVAGPLIERTLDQFAAWNIRHAGLFTFSHSPKHAGLYQKFGFAPRFLTAIMSRRVTGERRATRWSAYSALPHDERERCVRACGELTGAIYEGLDVEREIRAVHAQGLGDTVLLDEGGRLVGLAVCHCGPGSEAGSDTCYVKFGAVRPGPAAAETFERLLDACEAFAHGRRLSRLVAGVNTARHDAYRRMGARGFRIEILGVAMHRPSEPGYSRPDAYVVDDWR